MGDNFFYAGGIDIGILNLPFSNGWYSDLKGKLLHCSLLFYFAYG